MLNSTRELGKVEHLVSYSLLHSYVWFYTKGGLTKSAFRRAHQNRMLYQYGVPESDLLTWSVLNKAMTTYQMHVLKRDEPKASICPICGPRPNFLCCDGVATGYLVDKVKDENNVVIICILLRFACKILTTIMWL